MSDYTDLLARLRNRCMRATFHDPPCDPAQHRLCLQCRAADAIEALQARVAQAEARIAALTANANHDYAALEAALAAEREDFRQRMDKALLVNEQRLDEITQLREALAAEQARSDLHAKINEEVATALGQEVGESWHDLGTKVATLKNKLKNAEADRDEWKQAYRSLAKEYGRG